jgi:polyisoprenoid-binding protein YceI
MCEASEHSSADLPQRKLNQVARKAPHTVTGRLDLHGVQKTITLPAHINVAADAVTVNSEFAINRKDFGIVYAGKADDLIRDEVVLKLSVKAPRG